MKVLLDHCVPGPLLRHLHGVEAKTARAMGWDRLENGLLVTRAENEFDVMIMADRNIRCQQNLATRKLAFVILPTNYLPTVIRLAPQIRAALADIMPGGWIEIEFTC